MIENKQEEPKLPNKESQKRQSRWPIWTLCSFVLAAIVGELTTEICQHFQISFLEIILETIKFLREPVTMPLYLLYLSQTAPIVILMLIIWLILNRAIKRAQKQADELIAIIRDKR